MRNVLVAAAAIAVFASPIVARSAQAATPALASIEYFVATQNQAISVAPAVYATYVGSCLNADAQTPSYDVTKRNAVYVCNVRPKVVSEMENLNFVPATVGYRNASTDR